jgi:hypothetical protein
VKYWHKEKNNKLFFMVKFAPAKTDTAGIDAN